MNTKQRGDIAEQAVALEALKRGWGVLRPLGDNLPYDLVFDVSSHLIKIQVKSAWWDALKKNYVVDNRRTKTNRRRMVRAPYRVSDFDFAIAHIPGDSVFYIYPVSAFMSFGSEIHMVEEEKRQRKPKSALYREAWHLLSRKS